MIKGVDTEGATLDDAFTSYMVSPHAALRRDYADVASSRESDIRRMLMEATMTKGDENDAISMRMSIDSWLNR